MFLHKAAKYVEPGLAEGDGLSGRNLPVGKYSCPAKRVLPLLFP